MSVAVDWPLAKVVFVFVFGSYLQSQSLAWYLESQTWPTAANAAALMPSYGLRRRQKIGQQQVACHKTLDTHTQTHTLLQTEVNCLQFFPLHVWRGVLVTWENFCGKNSAFCLAVLCLNFLCLPAQASCQKKKYTIWGFLFALWSFGFWAGLINAFIWQTAWWPCDQVKSKPCSKGKGSAGR